MDFVIGRMTRDIQESLILYCPSIRLQYLLIGAFGMDMRDASTSHYQNLIHNIGPKKSKETRRGTMRILRS
jgi:hypothetical protein